MSRVPLYIIFALNRKGCADFPTFVGGVLPPRQVIRLLFEIIVPSLRVSAALFFFFFFFVSSPPPLHLVPTFSSALPSPTLEPLKWQSFLRRRPVEAKRGERSTGSSLDALRFSYAAISRVSGSTEGTRRMNITGWTVCSAS